MDDYDNISNYRVSQTAHGFAVGDVLRTAAAGTYAKAQADSDANAEVCGICSEVIDANTFRLRVIGRQTGLSGLVADTVYFLSHVTAGALTTTDPATLSSGFVSKPVLLTDSTTSGVILTYRGINDGGGGDAGPATLDSISDVNAPSPTDGQVLTYNNTSGDWEAADAAGGGGGWETVTSTDLTTAGNPTSIEYTGLAANYVYRVRFHNISTNSGSSTFLTLAFSTNNGSSYLEAGANSYGHYMDYISISGASTSFGVDQEANVLGYSMSLYNGNRTTGALEVHDLNNASGKPHIKSDAWSNDRIRVRGACDYNPTSSTQVNAMKLDFLNGIGFGATGKIVLERQAI